MKVAPTPYTAHYVKLHSFTPWVWTVQLSVVSSQKQSYNARYSIAMIVDNLQKTVPCHRIYVAPIYGFVFFEGLAWLSRCYIGAPF